MPSKRGRTCRDENPLPVTPQEQFFESDKAALPSNDIGSSFSHGRTRRPGTERFAGATNPAMAWSWIDKLEKFFDEMGYSNDRRVLWAAALLDSDAHYWWMSIEQGYENPSSIVWTNFLTHFFDKYINSGARLGTAVPTEFRPQAEASVGCEGELRSRPRPMDVGGPSWGPSMESTSGSDSSSGCSPSSYNSGARSSFKRRKQGARQRFKSNTCSYEYRGASRNRQPIPRDYPQCPSCGRHHMGECQAGSSVCFQCGQHGHFMRNCPQLFQGAGTAGGSSST